MHALPILSRHLSLRWSLLLLADSLHWLNWWYWIPSRRFLCCLESLLFPVIPRVLNRGAIITGSWPCFPFLVQTEDPCIDFNYYYYIARLLPGVWPHCLSLRWAILGRIIMAAIPKELRSPFRVSWWTTSCSFQNELMIWSGVLPLRT